MDERRLKKVAIVGSVVVAIVVAVVVTTIVLVSKGYQCELMDSRPMIDYGNLVASQDNKTLVSLSGYIEIGSVQHNDNDNEAKAATKNRYMAINANNVSFSAQNPYKLSQMTVYSTCNSVTFEMVQNSYGLTSVKSISINQTDSSGESKYLCSINDTGIEVPRGQGYVCSVEQVFVCIDKESRDELIQQQQQQQEKLFTTNRSKKNQRHISLVLEQLQFEFHGDPQVIKKRKFSKYPHYCI